MKRSRSLFDSIEAFPLTEEQRSAVVIDDRRNLVIAAARSGKTSVIVAKAGWLIARNFRKPTEILLLAFAKNAQNEMLERIRSRLNSDIADALTVRTFHSLGLAIVGEAERKRPDLSKAADDSSALNRQLKSIVSRLEGDQEFFTR